MLPQRVMEKALVCDPDADPGALMGASSTEGRVTAITKTQQCQDRSLCVSSFRKSVQSCYGNIIVGKYRSILCENIDTVIRVENNKKKQKKTDLRKY
jgi:hypothetical protein